jgi:hypothetical protein
MQQIHCASKHIVKQKRGKRSSVLLGPDIASHNSAVLALRPSGNRHEAYAAEVAETEFRPVEIANDGSLRGADIG